MTDTTPTDPEAAVKADRQECEDRSDDRDAEESRGVQTVLSNGPVVTTKTDPEGQGGVGGTTHDPSPRGGAGHHCARHVNIVAPPSSSSLTFLSHPGRTQGRDLPR